MHAVIRATLAVVAVLALAGAADAAKTSFFAVLNGAQEVPPTTSTRCPSIDTSDPMAPDPHKIRWSGARRLEKWNLTWPRRSGPAGGP